MFVPTGAVASRMAGSSDLFRLGSSPSRRTRPKAREVRFWEMGSKLADFGGRRLTAPPQTNSAQVSARRLEPRSCGTGPWPQTIDRSPGQSVMPHIDTPQVKQHILADVGSVVGDPLQVADYEEQVDSRR